MANKIIKIKNLITDVRYMASDASPEVMQVFEENIAKGKYGKGERWVREGNLTDYEKTVTPLEEKEETVVSMEGIVEVVKTYKLPPEYTLEITDYIPSYMALRQKAYEEVGLSPQALTVAIIEHLSGDSTDLLIIQGKRAQIKEKHPKN